MKHRVLKILDYFLWTLLALIVLMWATGGFVLGFSWGKIEFSSLDPWVIVWGVLLFLRVKFTGSVSCSLYEWLKNCVLWLREPNKSALVFIYLLVFVFGLLFVAHVFKQLSFSTHAYDQVFMHQPFFYPFTGGTPLLCDMCFNGTYLGDHLSFSMFFLTPVLMWARSFFFHDYWLYFVQVLLLSLPLFFIIKFGALKKHASLWGIAIIIILSQRALRNAAVWDFREDIIAYLGYFFACFGLLRGQILVYIVFIILSWLSKENMALLGLFLFFPILFEKDIKLTKKERLWLSVFTIFCALIWSFVSFKLLIPIFSGDVGAHGSNIVSRLGAFGKTPYEILINILSSPNAWWRFLSKSVLTFGSFKYLVLLFAPLIYFLRKSPWWIIAAFPGVCMNLLSSAGTQRTLEFHYELGFLPFLFIGVMLGLIKYEEEVKVNGENWGGRGFIIAIVLALAFSGRWPGAFVSKYFPDKHEVSDSLALASVQVSGVMASSLNLLPQINHIQGLRVLNIPEVPINKAGAAREDDVCRVNDAGCTNEDDAGVERKSDENNFRKDSYDNEAAFGKTIAYYWGDFIKNNLKDRTAIDGHGAAYAQNILLDGKEPRQKYFGEVLNFRDWKKTFISPSGRYVVWSKP